MKTELEARLKEAEESLKEAKILQEVYTQTREYDRLSGKTELIAYIINEIDFLSNLLNRL